MNPQTVTITLPPPVYRCVKQQSQLTHSSIAEELLAVVTDYSLHYALTDDIEQELAQLDVLTERELWQAAQTKVSSEATDAMQALVEKQQREGLTDQERQQAHVLSHFFNRTMLVRAKAAAILKQRGHDVSHLVTEDE